ncbi:non-ribosomal peptide synthetase [Lewinella cohaerens]|uniref:non-ribosomal peptide synthetase n=1 Tax=Lewinella cohaerens TaxID=70995 RepID=UPI000378B0E2|nr:non-ribosomal peptide synthetase [Lewinella cohaerens]
MELSPAKRALLEKWRKGQQLSSNSQEIARRPENSPLSLSLPQQRQLFLELLDRGTAVNNLSVLIELKGKLDVAALEQSANQILGRHEVLRTSFKLGLGAPVPEVTTALAFQLPLVDLQQQKGTTPEQEARRLAEQEVLQPFDLSQAPLIRLQLYQLEAGRHWLLVIAHHTVADGWSLGVFLKELMAFYGANTTSKPAQVAELAIQYADYAHWQLANKQEETLQASMAYWKQQLAGELPVLELPTDRQRGARQTFSGGTHRFRLSKATTAALDQLSKEEDVTLFMTLLTTFYVLLYRYSGQEEVLVGTPVANRQFSELEPLIGVFINTLVLRMDFAEDRSWRDLLKRVRKMATDAYAHQKLPFEKLVEVLKPKRDLSRSPLFQVVFNLQSSPLPKLEMNGLEADFLEIDRGVSQFDLTLMVSKIEEECLATVEYNRDLFEPVTVERMFQSFQLLLNEVLIQPDQAISKLPLLPEGAITDLLSQLNDTQLDIPDEKCLPHLFEEQVARTPNKIALVFDKTKLSYLELNKRINALARHLHELGVGPEVRVGVLMKKSSAIIESLLAVLKIGGTYVPIHASFPAERVQYILGDAEVKVLLTNIAIDLAVKPGVSIVYPDSLELVMDRAGENLPRLAQPSQLAYLIYTSGSTGKPKGVMLNHSSLTNFLWSMRSTPGIEKKDILMALTSISFDIAALELFLPLTVGATVVVASEEMTTNPLLLADALDNYEVTMMQATPATWQLLIEAGWQGRQGLKALCGGEALSRKLANQLLDRVDELWNMYGPTETTIWSSVKQIHKGRQPITIGEPIANTQLYVLDHHLQPLPLGVVGELHIGGAGLARGYLNRPALTNEKFITDFFSTKQGARLYKTGDYARHLADGAIVVLGRIDDQLKINGHRIELGEIAAVLRQHPAVSDAIALVRTGKLVAYFIPKKEESPGNSELRAFFSEQLPTYMIPSFFVKMDAFPLTPNGKIDRNALPMPTGIIQVSVADTPRNEEEQLLVKIWQNVLELEQIGIYDNFFDLGGASIQSIQVVAKANMYGYRIGVENIFEHQTIAELATFIQEERQNHQREG